MNEKQLKLVSMTTADIYFSGDWFCTAETAMPSSLFTNMEGDDFSFSFQIKATKLLIAFISCLFHAGLV